MTSTIWIGITATSGVRSGRPTVKTPTFIDLPSRFGFVMSGHQGHPLPDDLVLEGLALHAPAQFVDDGAAHAPALATLRVGDVVLEAV